MTGTELKWIGPAPQPTDYAALIDMAERLMRAATLNDMAYEVEGSQTVKQAGILLQEFRAKFGYFPTTSGEEGGR